MPRISRKRILIDLADAKEQMQRWHGASPEKIVQKQEEFDADWADYSRAVNRAIRAAYRTYPSLFEHPLFLETAAACLEWQRRLGQKDEMRAIDKELGLEVGVERPEDFVQMREDLWILHQTKTLVRDENVNDQEQIRRTLRRRLNADNLEYDPRFLLPQEAEKLSKRLKMSQQGFNKLLKRLGFAIDR